MRNATLMAAPFAIGGNSALHASSPAAHSILGLLTLSFIVCAIIFAIVGGAIAWCVIRFRRREGDEREPTQTHGNRRLEILWTVVPLLLLVGLFTMTARAMRVADAPPVGPPDLVIIGHQWWWEARYMSSPSTAEPIVTATEIHIPVGKRILVRIESADVIHDFWVPELARKIDAIPGHPNTLWLEADAPGTYAGACAEYCGAQHAWMRFLVIAESPADYEAWLASQRPAARLPEGAAAVRGAKLFREKTCINCHAIRGASDAFDAPNTNARARSVALVAPDLTHLASRHMIAGGAAANTPTELTRWLKNPAAIKPGARMPNLSLTDSEAADLVSYLEPAP